MAGSAVVVGSAEAVLKEAAAFVAAAISAEVFVAAASTPVVIVEAAVSLADIGAVETQADFAAANSVVIVVAMRVPFAAVTRAVSVPAARILVERVERVVPATLPAAGLHCRPMALLAEIGPGPAERRRSLMPRRPCRAASSQPAGRPFATTSTVTAHLTAVGIPTIPASFAAGLGSRRDLARGHVAGHGAWCGWGSAAPIVYDYGNNVTYQGDQVYYGDQPVATADQYYQQASDIAKAPAAAPDPQSDDWLPLGVFSLIQGDQSDTNTMFQLAVNKAGVIRAL